MTHPLGGPTLALDTSGRACGVCVWRDGAVLARADQAMEHGQAEALAPIVRAVLADAGLTATEMTAIAVTVGPGSFTGLRVGLSFARGLALAAGCPVLGVTSTAVLARMAAAAPPRDTPIAVALDARRAEVFLQVFDADLRAMGEPVSLPPADARDSLPKEPTRLTGDGAALLPALAPHAITIVPDAERPPDPAILAAMAAKDPGSALPARPLYVRPPDATRPPPDSRSRP
ncbi:tRNA (adenosine(37)-N6)-threonylcarbamoyltransferase complex dimerization subunit type 1 TsaB [uncultured Rhodospira sp.]|uniref:tRNA (adenosine(37)-N6)-threonylcarbamoyltransferase complex dimerization subunit type 1 TsaB n=1 Tax=uncultured Rhodospira sp. TaxID=1936189 RepID=UPI002606E772|nr:tRNA (adenosine(37)-N6)-threonylcarbamoyltransferase complex dimerization subunit type 1 TsaB [uncultured Rhodospira sp.]